MIENLLEQSAEKWRICESFAESDLLRLVVLRDLVYELHAEKSRLLSKGKKPEAKSLRATETRAEELRGCKPLSGDLRALLQGENKLKKRTRMLPEAVFGVIEREKLERYDRQWEAAILSEALSAGWRVWSLEVWVEIPKIDDWNRRILEQLWPHGIVLYVESAGSQNATAWFGRWICVLHPKFHAPGEISLDIGNWPGTQSSPSWQPLFSAEKWA